jgi:23S rRNA pseudouridine2605 synthase
VVNGRRARDPLARVPVASAIAIDGLLAAAGPGAARLVAFHKPRGLVTTRRDPEGRPTVFDHLGEAARGLVAVGRLDRASTGLLLLTNDTALAHRLTDPASALVRRYVVTARGRVDEATARRLEAGLDTVIAGRRVHLAADRIVVLKVSARESHLRIDLTEGKNREIRRLLEAAGHEVTRVHRVAFGPYELGDLPPGRSREVRVLRPA